MSGYGQLADMPVASAVSGGSVPASPTETIARRTYSTYSAYGTMHSDTVEGIPAKVDVMSLPERICAAASSYTDRMRAQVYTWSTFYAATAFVATGSWWFPFYYYYIYQLSYITADYNADYFCSDSLKTKLEWMLGFAYVSFVVATYAGLRLLVTTYPTEVKSAYNRMLAAIGRDEVLTAGEVRCFCRRRGCCRVWHSWL